MSTPSSVDPVATRVNDTPAAAGEAIAPAGHDEGRRRHRRGRKGRGRKPNKRLRYALTALGVCVGTVVVVYVLLNLLTMGLNFSWLHE